MYQYRAYDLIINSDFEVPELPEESESAPADIRVQRSAVKPVTDSIDSTQGRDIEVTADACRLTYDTVGTFLVEDGSRIRVDVKDDILETKRFTRLLTNEVMGILLFQRDYLVLHASAVSVGESGIVFLGKRGAGKSTAAAAFFSKGYPVLADDVVAIHLTGDEVTLLPGVPELRLLPDAVDGLKITGTSEPVGDWGPDKRYRSVSRAEPVPLTQVYILRYGDELTTRPFSGREAVLSLLESTYVQGLLSHTQTTPDNFSQCSTVSKAASFDILERPRDHDRLPDMVDFVADDVRG